MSVYVSNSFYPKSMYLYLAAGKHNRKNTNKNCGHKKKTNNIVHCKISYVKVARMKLGKKEALAI